MRPLSLQRRAYWLDYGPMWLLLVFTVIALAGYFFFALRPENLSILPQFASVYGVSFVFFARTHVLLTAVVLIAYLVRRAGWRWLGAFAIIYAVSFTSEFIGTGYGIPFGAYHYTSLLGPTVFERVPYLIPLSWFGMAVPSYVLARAAFPGPRRYLLRIGLGALILTTWDLSLDPAMSYLTSYWVWGEEGSFYGMPLINLFGWFVTGLALMGLLVAFKVDRWIEQLSVRWMALYYGLTLLMPFGMVLAAGLWGAAGVTLLAVGAWGWFIYRRRASSGDGPASTYSPSATQTKPDAPANDLPLADEIPADAWDYFSRHSRSFSFAALGFAPEERRRVSYVYAFCRLTDDLVDQADHLPPERVEARLDAWLDVSRAAYEGRPSGIAWLDEIMQFSRESGMPFSVIESLGEGVRMDLGKVALCTVEELDLYAYRVASVVGLWLCYLFGVTEPWALQRAAALGRAMQITNILRDVGEDLSSNRVYLPAEVLDTHGVSEADLRAMLAGGPIQPTYRRVIDELMARADRYYEQAWEAIPVLPKTFGRVTAVAAEVYRGIHHQIQRNHYNNFTRRARTSFREKVKLCIGARWRLAHLRCEQRKAQRLQSEAERRPRLAPADPATVNQSGGVMARLAVLVHLFLSGFFLIPMVVAQPADAVITQLRQYYLDSAADEQYIDTAMAFLDAYPERYADPLIEGYRGALTVMRAKHAFWPLRKMAHLKDGLPVLDRLVQEHPGHAELRYLRLLSCYFLPGFLGRGWSVEEDVQVLGDLLPYCRDEYPPDLYQTMVQFVMHTEKLEADQYAALERALAASLDESACPADE